MVRSVVISFMLVLLSLSFATRQVYAQHDPVIQQQEDPYLWLEQIDDEKALDWVRTRNKKTLAVLKNQPAFQEIYDKNLEIYNSDERIAYPEIRGDYLYNFWQDGKNERGVWRRTTLQEYRKPSPDWEVLIDIDALAEAEVEKWVYKGVECLYPNYERCMVSLSRGGGDAVVMREFDLKSKQFVDDGFYLPEAKGSVSWKEENTLYVSTDFGEGTTTESGYPRVNKVWRRGTPLSEAQTLFEADVSDVGLWSEIINTPARQYQVIYRAITFFTFQVYTIENGEPRRLDIPEDAEFEGFFKNQMLIDLKSDWTVAGNTYKQGSLVGIDYDTFLGGDRNFSVIVAPEERSSVTAIENTKNFVLINKLKNVCSELYRYSLNGGSWHGEKVEAPDFGSISIITTDENSDRYFFSYNSFLKPSTLYFVSEDGRATALKSLPKFFADSRFEVEQFEATSEDGTRIPYFRVHEKGARFDATNPTLLYGYGGFEVSIRPSYSPTVGTAWLERGGVYAVANIRGGGEFGPQWHQSALKENRQRAYDDFIAVAEDLVSRGVTSPHQLGIIGRSNGGLLVGVAFTQRPELFKAVVCGVPLLDMKRYNKLLAGASWMGEYGNPDIPDEWAFIKKFSPYHNVHADIKYPRIFFHTSTRDDRVHPGHARKMAAKMEAMGHELYYYENIEGGHAAATTNQQRAFKNALIYTYLWQQLKQESFVSP